jgi:hypothetical protein
MSWNHFGAGDAFALVMLGVITLSFGTVFLLLVAMLRHSGRRDVEVDRLIEEAAREEATDSPPVSGDEPRDPWEKKPDWWR